MFPCTNNAAEYEALLHGLRMTKEMSLSRVRCFGDSDLVAQQVSITWDSKDPLMVAYRREVDAIAGHFKGYQVEHVDRRKNEAVDALSWLGSLSDVGFRQTLKVRTLGCARSLSLHRSTP